MNEINLVINNAVELFGELLSLQKHYYVKKIELPNLFFSEDEMARHNDGEIFLSFYRITSFWSDRICFEITKEVCSLLKKYRPELKSKVEGLYTYLCNNSDIFDEFLEERSISRDGVPERELLSFIVYQTMRPLLEKYAETVKRFSQHEEWLRDFCPVCGQKAYISFLRRGDGKRILVCPLCSTEWVYRYLACSWCGNDEPKSIKYFEVAEYPAYEVYLCDKCRCYLKTFNEKKGFEHDHWLLEDIKTLPLDMLALKEGYNGLTQKLL